MRGSLAQGLSTSGVGVSPDLEKLAEGFHIAGSGGFDQSRFVEGPCIPPIKPDILCHLAIPLRLGQAQGLVVACGQVCSVLMQILHHLESPLRSSNAQCRVVRLANIEAILMQVPHHLEVSMHHGSTQGLVIPSVQVGTVFMQEDHGVKMTVCHCSYERRILVSGNAGTTAMDEVAYCLQVASSRCGLQGLSEIRGRKVGFIHRH